MLLALLSWVFIATINPDVLYIKQPGSSFTNSPVSGACYKEYDDTLFTCKCIDDFVALFPPYADATACDDECRATNHCGLDSPTPCIAPGSPPEFTSLNFDKEPYNGRCKCIDDVFIKPIGGATNCNEACSNIAFADDGLNHCYIADFRIGNMNMGGNYLPSDKERAKKYALYSAESIDSALDFTVGSPDSCYLAVNGADYTTNFDEVTKMVLVNGSPLFDGNCNNPLNMDILNPLSPSSVSGYIGPVVQLLSCPMDGINSVYGFWETDANCRKIKDPESVVCPIKFCVEWNGGAIVKQKIMYLQMLNSY